MPTTLVIGMGISASAYLASLSRLEGDVYVMGGDHLWQQLSGSHRMGQSVPLLSGNLLGKGKAYREFENPHAREGRGFMRADVFAKLVDDQLKNHSAAQIPGVMVTAIRPSLSHGFNYDVEYRLGKTHTCSCHNVIVATGPGPSRALRVGEDGKLGVDVTAFEGHVVGGTEFLSPLWRMPPGVDQGSGKRVAVYGGSATASWAVEMAELRGMEVARWFTRPGSGMGAWDPKARFEAAFPHGGRNTEVQKRYEDARAVLKLVAIELVQKGTSFLLLTFEDKHGTVEKQPVDLLVYSLGAEHSKSQGIYPMLAGTIRKKLVAYYDRNMAISPQRCLLAIGTGDGSLMIIGSALSSAAGFGGNELAIRGDPATTMSDAKIGTYAQISDTLPPAARPTEGIAMIMASVEALNEYMPVLGPTREATFTNEHGEKSTHGVEFAWDINFNTSNRTQLAVYLAQTTNLEPFAANLAVELILHFRTAARQTFGITGTQVRAIMGIAKGYHAVMRRLNPEFDKGRLAQEKKYGVDWVLGACVTELTTLPVFLTMWEDRGLFPKPAPVFIKSSL